MKLDELTPSSTSGNSQQQPPTSPTNGTTQDPLKTTNLSAPRRQNSTDNVPAEKESPVTPNRSDDDKGEATPASDWQHFWWCINWRIFFTRKRKGERQSRWASDAGHDPTTTTSEAEINRRGSRGCKLRTSRWCSNTNLFTFLSPPLRTLIPTTVKSRRWTMARTKMWWVRRERVISLKIVCTAKRSAFHRNFAMRTTIRDDLIDFKSVFRWNLQSVNRSVVDVPRWSKRWRKTAFGLRIPDIFFYFRLRSERWVNETIKFKCRATGLVQRWSFNLPSWKRVKESRGAHLSPQMSLINQLRNEKRWRKVQLRSDVMKH